MAVVAGFRTTGRGPSANQLKLDMSDSIYLLDEDDAPFLALTSRMGKEAATQPKFMWLEDVLTANVDETTQAELAAAVTVHVVHREYFKAGDLIHVPRTGEVFKCTATPAASGAGTIAVTRSVGDKWAAQALVNKEVIVIIGNANAEGSDRPDMISTVASEKYNYCQLIRTSFGITNTAAASNFYGGDQFAQERMKKGKKHARQIESVLFFGDRGIINATGLAERYTGGMRHFINTNVTDLAGAVLSEDYWNAWLETVFDFGSSEKVIFCSNALMRAITGFGLANLTVRPGDKELGMNITSYLSPFGHVSLIQHKLFSREGYPYLGVGVDLDNVQLRPLQGRDTGIYDIVPANGADRQEQEYKTEVGLEVKQEKTHAWLENFRV